MLRKGQLATLKMAVVRPYLFVTVLSKGQLAALKMMAFGHIWWRTIIIFWQIYLGIERNSYARFRRNSSSGFGVDAITDKNKDGQRRPHLLMDWYHIRVDTTRPLGEQLRQVSKKSNQWSQRKCHNEKVYWRMDGRMDDRHLYQYELSC